MKTIREISNSDSVIDSRDVIARIEALEEERESLVSAIDDAKETLADAKDDTSVLADDPQELAELESNVTEAEEALTTFDEDEEGQELKVLKALQEEAEGYSSDWKYGATLIRRSYWIDYVEEMLKDCGDLPQNIPWYITIDWEKTADNLKMDYTEVDFDGVSYFVR